MSGSDLGSELAALRVEFQGHRICTESIVDRVRYVARSQREGVHPHTVITPDLGELRAALEAGRPGGQGTVRT
ncbi:MAG TPA: hypothetical protein VGA04_17460 [Streptosporangiaceae bacterium]